MRSNNLEMLMGTDKISHNQSLPNIIEQKYSLIPIHVNQGWVNGQPILPHWLGYQKVFSDITTAKVVVEKSEYGERTFIHAGSIGMYTQLGVIRSHLTSLLRWCQRRPYGESERPPLSKSKEASLFYVVSEEVTWGAAKRHPSPPRKGNISGGSGKSSFLPRLTINAKWGT